MNKSEGIWYENIFDLIDINNLKKFFPTSEMSDAEKLNSILRFTIYFTVTIYIFHKNVKTLYLIPLVALLTLLIDKYNNNNEDIKEDYEQVHLSSKLCTKPKQMNPFMNVLVNEYNENPDRKKACNIESKSTKTNMKKYFEHDLYQNVDDIYGRDASFRQFYTTASTTIPNDQGAFAKWLYYKDGKTCKEGNGLECK